MGEHTPTPWVFEDAFIRTAEDRYILCVPPNNPENGKNWENDAPFIVKAANQYEAHEAVALVALELVTECAGDIPPSLGVLEKLCTALNDLAKAKAASTHGEGG